MRPGLIRVILQAIFALFLISPLARGADPGKAAVVTLFEHGPRDQRINLVFLAEGYTEAELPQFLIEARQKATALLEIDPFSDYRNHFNAYAIPIASRESGSDHPSRRQKRETYFNSHFDEQGIARLLALPPAELQRVDTIVRSALGADSQGFPVVLVNDPEYGGSGAAGTPVISRDPRSVEILFHEFAHSFAGLADEYDLPGPSPVNTRAPNVTRETDPARIPWREWLTPGVPLPTRPHDASDQAIGLFEGAMYQKEGWYRPKADCRMRTFGRDFCEICREALIRELYRRLRPIRSAKPNPSSEAAIQISSSSERPPIFRVDLLAPSSHALKIEWRLDRNLLETGEPEFPFLASGLKPGLHRIEARVWDPTEKVRTDPKHLLEDHRSWLFQVTAPSR